MGCVNSWVSTELFCASLNRLNKQADPNNPNQFSDMFKELLQHVIEVGNYFDADTLISRYKANPSDPDVAQFKSDWDMATTILEQSRATAQRVLITKKATSRFDRIPNIETSIDTAINDYLASLTTEQPVSVPIKVNKTPEETMPETSDDMENQNGPGASQDEIPLVDQTPSILEINSIRDADTRGIVSIIQDMMGESRIALFGDFMKYMHAKVSNGWIDQEVRNGEVRGMVSPQHSARSIKAAFNNTLVDYYKSRSNGQLGVFADGESQGTFLYFDAANKPSGLQLVSEVEGSKRYKHDKVTQGDLRPDGTFEPVFFIVGDPGETIETVASKMTMFAKKINAVPYPSEPTNTEEDHLGNGFKTVPNNLKDVYFSSMISNNFEEFMRNFYPPILEGYKAKFRTGFSTNDATIVAADQDSARIFMHKRTTPRLDIMLDENGAFTGVKLNTSSPFLRGIDFELIADVIANNGFRRDATGLGEDIINYVKAHPKDIESNILASIYYRFFSPTDYTVKIDKDPVTGKADVEKTFRSYKGLVENNSINPTSEEDYALWIKNGENPEQATHINHNRMLDNAISGIVTSLSSAVQHESIISNNGSVRFTNTRSYDILPKYKSSIEAYTTVENAEGISVTNPRVIKDLKVYPAGNNAITVTIPDPRGKVTGDYKNKTLTYTVAINPGKASNGLLFTVKKFGTTEQLSFSELKDIFGQFNLSPVVLSSKFMSEFNSAASMIESEEHQERAVEQFLLSSLLLMEMNSENSTVAGLMGNKENIYSSSTMRFDPVEMLFKYKPVLEESLRGVFGVDNRQYALDHNGNKLAIVTLKNKIADSINLARQQGNLVSSIHKNGLLTGSDPKVRIKGFFSKTGIKVGEVTKANQDMTIHEQAALQIEQLFLQTAAESKYGSIALQPWVVSDKTNIPVVKLESTTGTNMFLPVKNNGSDLDTALLHKTFIDSQQTYWKNVAETTIHEWNKVMGILGLPALPNDIHVAAETIRQANIPYATLDAGSELTKNAMLAKSGDIAVIPQHILNNIALFNNETLSKEFTDTNLKLFKRALATEGYTKLSSNSLKLMKERFPNAEFVSMSDENAKEKAADMLFTAFFYNSNTLGQELLRLHTGGFIQFKTASGDQTFNIGPKGIDTKEVLAKAETLRGANVLIDSILRNKNLSKQDKAKALVFDEMASVHSNQFIDQVKRNAGMSSTGQYLRLNATNERGFLVGKSSKNVVINDPKAFLKIIGKTGVGEQDIYDAVQIGHPLYFIRLGNSLGNGDSNFSPKGAPVKDITNAMDSNGFYRFQKKATFNMFSNEMLRKGTPELYNMLVKANTAIRFPNSPILVHEVDPSSLTTKKGNFATPISREMWLRNGHNLGLVLDKTTGNIVDVASLINPINNARTTTAKRTAIAELEQKLADGSLLTDKTEKNFSNVQELWDYFGGSESNMSWSNVGDVIGNYAGIIDPSLGVDLAQANYPLRDAYIEKIGFKSQEKTGNKQLLHKDAVKNDAITFGGDGLKAWSEVDNTYHTVILQADHNPDTSHGGSSLSTDEAEAENHIPMITQILSAIVGEGMSVKDVIGVYNSLGITSILYNEQVDSEIDKIANDIKTKTKTNLSDSEIHKQAVSEYFIKQLRTTVSTMQTPGIIGDLIGKTYKDRMSFDTKQVLPLLTSTSNSVFNKNTVRMTFAGGQYVVSPSHDFVKTYSINGVDGYTREDLNKILYNSKHPINSIAENDPQFALQAASVSELLPNDTVVIDIDNTITYKDLVTKMGLQAGSIITFGKLKRLVKAHYQEIPELADVPFEVVLENFIADTTKFRLKGLRDNGNILKWSQYKRYDANGIPTEIKDTEEYKAFQAVDGVSSLEIVPKNLYKEYFFRDNRSDVHTTKQLAEFEDWYEKMALIERDNVKEFISTTHKTDPYFIKHMEKQLYNLLQEEGWTTEPAEFYMPSMHKKVFMLEDTDSLFDIIGAEQPNYSKVLSMGIFKPGTFSENVDGRTFSATFSDQEDIYRQLNTNFNIINKIFGKGSKLYEALSDIQKATYDEFAQSRIGQFNNSYDFFRKRLESKYRDVFTNIRSSVSIDQAIKKVKSRVKKTSSSSEEGKLWNSILTYLETEKGKAKEVTGSAVVDERSIIRSAFDQRVPGNKRTIIQDFYHKKAKKMASGFSTSLEFITARIPAQGKQSGTIGKIKNFIFSSRNSCYGPLEMLTMTGADYDIDKQNMMTWQFDDDGSLIDWKPFLDDKGAISKELFNEWVETSGMDKTKASEYFKLAVQNFIIHKIMTVFKAPQNAIEANTPVSMNKVKAAKQKPDLTKAVKANSIADILELRGFASPYNPADIFKYEKLNMDGKSGIGIFASDLKGYFATYYATITSTPDEQQYITFKSNSGLTDAEMAKYGINPNAVQYFDLKTGELLAESSSIANAGRYVGDGAKTSARAKEGINALQQLDANDPEFETKEMAILQEYLNDINNANNANVEEQAWEDLSELLSAATDNAKELILGQINATTDTSSIISTMVRMGIDLKYALQLVGHSDPNATPTKVLIGTKEYEIRDVRGLIKQLNDVGDTQKDGGGFARLTPVLEKMQPQIGTFSTQADIKAYLANPFRQLYTFAKMTEEFGLISSLLSINQGLKTTAYDVWKFKNSIESRVNDIIGDDAFKLDDFISSELGDKRYSSSIIEKFDKNRVGINVPFILSKNAHYFGYYNAMFRSKSLVGEISTIDRATEDIINRFADTKVKRRITDEDFKNIQNFIYGVSVEGYLKDKVFTINGKTFDLSIASRPVNSDTDMGGRYEFIQYLPQAVYEASNFGIDNHFLNSIPVQDSVVDYVTQVKLPVLKGPNLMNISPERYAELKMGLSSLKKTHKELYDALYLYSLITTKGAFAGGSFMGLYGADKYIDFSEYVKNNAQYITAVASNKINDNMVKFNNPVFIETLSTDAKNSAVYNKKKKARISPDGEEIEDSWDSDDFVGEVFEEHGMDSESIHDGIDDDSFRRKKTFVDFSEKLFDMTGVTNGKLKGNIKTDMFRSKETGIIYQWDDSLKIWVPLIQKIPNTVIPYSAVNSTGLLSDTGFSIGWDVTLPIGGTNMVQKTSKVLAFLDNDLIKRLRDVPKGETTSELAKALGVDHNIPLARNTNYYIVRDERGKYSIESAATLMANSNNNLVLKGPKIVRKFSSGREDLELDRRHYFYQKDGILYDREIPGSVKTSSVMVNQARIAQAESLVGKFYPFDNEIMKNISNGIENTVSMNNADLDRKYEAFMRSYYDNLLIAHGEDRAAAKEELDSMFSVYDTPIVKLNNLYNAANLMKQRFAEVEYASTEAEVDDYFTNKTLIPSLVRRLLVDREALNNTSWGQIQELFKNIGVSGSDFRALVKKSLMGKSNKLDVYKGIVDSIVDTEGVPTPFRKLIVSDKVKESARFSKEHTIPEDMRESFNRNVSPQVMSKLINMLKERFPESSFVMMGTKQIEEEFGKQYSDPSVKAFVKNGSIIFNQERITLDTPVHEFSHIYMQYLKVDNKDLYNKLVNEALNHPLADHIQKSYPDLNKFELGEEVVVSLIAAHVSGLTDENGLLDNMIQDTSRGKKVFEKILDFFKDLFAKAFNISPTKLKFNLTDSLGDIISQIGNEVAYGKGSILEDFSPELKNMIKQSRKGELMEFTDVLKLLREKGFIEKVCV